MSSPNSLDLMLSFAGYPITLQVASVDSDAPNKWDAGRHCNANFEVHVLMSGSCVLEIDNQRVPFRSPSAILIAPNVYHCAHMISPDFKRFSFGFTSHRTDFLESLQVQGGLAKNIPVQPSTSSLCQIILEEVSAQNSCREDLLRGLFTQLLALLFRGANLDVANTAAPVDTAAYRTSIIDLFFDPKTEPFGTEDELAAKLNLSRRQLNRVMMQYYGIGFRQKMLAARMEYAGNYLRNTLYSAKEISRLIGYTTETSFHKAFQNFYHMTPQQYREFHQSKHSSDDLADTPKTPDAEQHHDEFDATEVVLYPAPFDAEEMLSKLEEIFGKEERLLETPQLTGREASENTDIVLLAKKNGSLVGAIHGTIPKHDPHLAGLSAMFTTQEARGIGLGKKLFGQMVETLESRGATAIFLGTSNPIAEKLYASFGFRYLFGSGVMARFSSGAAVDFTKSRFDAPAGTIHIEEGSPKMRIPIVPLTLSRLGYKIYDANLGLVNPEVLSQYSCMGLYPRYMELAEQGGRYFGAYDEAGVLGAAATATEDGRFDGFAYPAFEEALQETFRKTNASYMVVADMDDAKIALAEKLGLHKAEETFITVKGIAFPAHNYK